MKNANLLQKQFETTRIAAEEAGPVVNTPKTKTMMFGKRNIEQAVHMAVTIVENVDKFEYLGSLITWDSCSEEIRGRIDKAAGAMHPESTYGRERNSQYGTSSGF